MSLRKPGRTAASWPRLALAATLASGCAAAWLPAALPGYARIEVLPAIGGERAVQAAFTGYASPDVSHLVIKAFTVANSIETPASGQNGAIALDIPNASFSSKVVLDGLARNTKYRLRGYAYAQAGTASADLLSVDAQSYVDVDVAADDRPTVAKLSVQLKARAFSGQATGSLDVRAGNVTDVGGEFVTSGGQS